MKDEQFPPIEGDPVNMGMTPLALAIISIALFVIYLVH